MEGRQFGTSDFIQWIDGGAIVNFREFRMDKLVELMTAQINSVIINSYWTMQRIVVLGGTRCNEDAGLGNPPADGTACIDGLRWSILDLAPDPNAYDRWSDLNNPLSYSDARWGHVGAPPGMYELGQGDFADITVTVRALPSLCVLAFFFFFFLKKKFFLNLVVF